ncbi:MAG: hypothetical protein UE068_05700 [Paludibacteraceae bacterium]|nr:hypothetical protein [Paludibacteraceae bacterium]
MTDREIIETILEQKGNDLRKRLIEYINQVNFHDYDKDKKIHLCPGAEDEEDYNNLIIGATILAKKADDFGLSLIMKECHLQISSLDMDYCINTLTKRQ